MARISNFTAASFGKANLAYSSNFSKKMLIIVEGIRLCNFDFEVKMSHFLNSTSRVDIRILTRSIAWDSVMSLHNKFQRNMLKIVGVIQV